MENFPVSIIIPVYNSMPYLKECLDSIEAQTFQDFEVICVDDGSTDDSPAVLAEYAEKDPRIRVIRQENSGAAAARNRGIEDAAGEYLFFSDADDRLMPELLEKALARGKATAADVVLFSHYELDHDTGRLKQVREEITKVLPAEKTVFSPADVPEQLFLLVSLVPWNRLVRRAFVIRENLRYQNLRNANDYYFCLMCMAAAERIAYEAAPLYCYRRLHGSATDRTRGTSYLCRLEASLAAKASLEERGLMERFGKCWRVKTVGLLGSKLKKEPLSRTARCGLLEQIRKESAADPLLLGMQREAYDPYEDYYDLLEGGIRFGLPFADRQQGREKAECKTTEAQSDPFESLYHKFLEYLSELSINTEEEVSENDLESLYRAEVLLREVREMYKALPVQERSTYLGLPDRMYALFVHLVDEYVRQQEDAEKRQQKNDIYLERINDLKKKNDIYLERISDLKKKNEEKKELITSLKQQKPFWRR